MYSLFYLNKGRNGVDDSANAGRYLCRLCIDPMNRVRGGVSALLVLFF